MKKYLSILILCLFQFGYSQNKEILVLDKATKLPIEGVNIYYPEINEGTFTNSDGKASIQLREMDLKITNISYEQIIIKSKDVKSIETIYLIPSSVQLDEVVVKSFDLRKAFNYVLDNYEALYGKTPFEKECDFKETLSINDQLKRLTKTKINWWGKGYKKSNGYKDLKLRLGAIDYHKNEKLDIIVDVPSRNTPLKSGYLDSKSLINMIYLNSFLNSWLANTGSIRSTVEKSELDKIKISYETDWKTINNVSTRSIGTITFDKESKAIIDFVNKIELKNRKDIQIIEENKKEFLNETKSSANRYSFNKNNEGKWSLQYFDITIEFDLSYENEIYKGFFENNLYVLKENKTLKVDDNGLVAIDKPFYQNLPSSTINTNSNSILLDDREKKFLQSKN
jgi:CarboxypepD_reg-like domain